MFVDSIENLVYDSNNDYKNYKTKILTWLNDNDINKLSKELFFHDNNPLLQKIGQDKQYKMFKLFLNCLFHFSENVLNEQEPDNICTIYNENKYNCNGWKRIWCGQWEYNTQNNW